MYLHKNLIIVLIQCVVAFGLVILVQLVKSDTGLDIIKIADAETPANGPFALRDAPPKDDGSIDRKNITDKWFILRKSLTWGEALIACENASAHLVVLAKESEAQNIANTIATSVSEQIDPIDEYIRKFHEVEFGPDRRYWIGLTDQLSEGKWMWVKNKLELLYDFWYPGQPDHVRPNAKNKGEHCVTLWNPGYYEDNQNTHQFNDEPCHNKYYPICGTGNPTY